MKTLTITVLFTLSQICVFALDFKGKVLDENNDPLPGAVLQNRNKGTVAIADFQGDFYFKNCNMGDTLKVFVIGFETTQYILDEKEDNKIFKLMPKPISLSQVLISKKIDPLYITTKIDLKLNPISSSQDLLRVVPGLFIGQHAGGGKAEQIFLRGFDIDHGTDLSISVDGMPVNMVSHAHGQGYADMHFIIPETVEDVSYSKGSYTVENGNFNTAGDVKLKLFDKLRNSEIKVEKGQFAYTRIYSGIKIFNSKALNAFVASEYLLSDGPFVSPQNFSRINVLSKISGNILNTKYSLSASYFKSDWAASGQIPQRAVDAGLISRFGAIDDKEGGNTSRKNLSFNFVKPISSKTTLTGNYYASKYDFELFSNFTFFLNDPINGDQIKQKENRTLFGGKLELINDLSTTVKLVTGIGNRSDRIRNIELSNTLLKTTTLNQVVFGNINESNNFIYQGFTFESANFVLDAGLRFDNVSYNYENKLEEINNRKNANSSLVSYKFSLNYTYSRAFNYYFKVGTGFHSNDTRTVTNSLGNQTLPRSIGADLGINLKSKGRFLLNAALWNLYLKQEFVYVGDAGIVELSGPTLRNGIDLSPRLEINKYLFLKADFTYSHARSLEAAKGEDFIPLAPVFTALYGLSLKDYKHFSANISSRFLGDRSANEDASVIAKGYNVTDLSISHKYKKLTTSLFIQNVFNTNWNETQFETESRLKNESSSVTEIHFTPGTPINARLSVSIAF